MDREPGRIGFMSTRRQEGRARGFFEFTRTFELRARRLFLGEKAAGANSFGLQPFEKYFTAPTRSWRREPQGCGWFQSRVVRSDEGKPSMKTLAGMAARCLDSDSRKPQADWLAFPEVRRGLPLRSARVRAQMPLRQRLKGRPPIPSPPGSARLHPTSPRAPAVYGCRTERHDGKGNLHLQHAA